MSTPRLDRRTFLRAGLAAGVVCAGAGARPARMARAAAGDLDFASALEAAGAIQAGRVSSVELTTRMLDRIARLNPKLNAIVALGADGALARARAADEARARRESWGRFHGVPITIKDTFEVAGLTTTAGAPSLRTHVPTRDAAVVARLKGAGAVVLGKTNVPIFASDWQSYNAVYGQTNNPWDVARTPGGSTGGGAAALAAGLSYLEPGSDLAGSIRIPAHFCGIYGHKPTLDVVPMRGHIPPPPGIAATPPSTLPVAGPLARSAADLLAALEVLGGPEGDDATRPRRWRRPSRPCGRRGRGSRKAGPPGSTSRSSTTPTSRCSTRGSRRPCAKTSSRACASSRPTRTARISPATRGRSPPPTRICRPSRRAGAPRAGSGRPTSGPTTLS